MIKRNIALALSFGLLLGAFTPTAQARIPDTSRINLGGSSHELHNKVVRTASSRVLQSFDFDSKTGDIYTIQLDSRQDGIGKDDDLRVTRLNSSGKILSSMLLRNFGHGVGIGVERVKNDIYLWTEAKPNSDGFGTAIARTKYVSKGNVDGRKSPAIRMPKELNPSTKGAAKSKTGPIYPSIDKAFGRITFMWGGKGGSKNFATYNLSDVTAFNTLTLAQAKFSAFNVKLPTYKDVSVKKIPAGEKAGSAIVFQGFTTLGQSIYTLQGTSFPGSICTGGSTSCVKTKETWNNMVISETPLKKGGLKSSEVKNGKTTSSVRSKMLTSAKISFNFREPEGIAIQNASSNNPRLVFGIADGVPGNRTVKFMYKTGVKK